MTRLANQTRKRRLNLELLERRDVPSFAAPQTYLAGSNPADIVNADFNGDGLFDVAVANQSSPGFVNVLLNNGAGGFGVPKSYPTGGAGCRSLTVADVSGDGKLDLVVANSGSANVAVLRGSGTGAFRRPITYAAGTNPRSLNLADVNNDGVTDIALATDINFSTTASVMLGQGGGAFQLFASYSFDTAVAAVTVGDFNADSRLDLAAAGHHDNSSKFAILLGNGDGTFAFGQQSTSASPGDITTADFNEDGILDLAVPSSASAANTIAIWQGTGGGTFFQSQTYTVGAGVKAVEAADIEGDGAIDLIVSNTEAATIDVLLGQGTGTFDTAVRYPGGASPSEATVRDFTGDGIFDVAVANKAFNHGSVTLLRGIGDGTFHGAVPIVDAGTNPIAIAATDFNADADPDLVVANGCCQSGSLSIALGAAGPNFNPKTNYYVGEFTKTLAVTDFDGDGVPDVSAAVNAPGSVSVTLGNSDGTLQTAPLTSMQNALFTVVIADFNVDGKNDVAGMTGDCCIFGGDDLMLFLGNGDGSFQPPTITDVGYSIRDLAVGDFNEDGLPDIAFGDYQNGPNPAKATILLNTGGGNFGSPITYPIGNSPWQIAVADFDSNGDLDLAFACNYGGGVNVLLGNGNGTFQSAQVFDAGEESRSVTIGDFDGSGTPDMAVTNVDTDTVEILLGNGDGSFQTAISHPGGGRPNSVMNGDFDGDGDLDLAVTDQQGRLNVLLGNGNGTFQPLVSYGNVTDHMLGTVADLDGDGILDIAAGIGIWGGDDASVAVYRGNGDGTFQPSSYHIGGNTAYDVAVGDLNGDSRPDLVATLGLSVLINNGSGFVGPTGYNAGQFPFAVAAADFNADGDPDLAVSNNVGLATVSILLAKGGGEFSTVPVAYAVGANPSGITIGDFNQDGDPDLAVSNKTSANVSILLGNGDGTFQTAVNYAAGATPVAIVAADMDGDGDFDLAIANSENAGTVSVLKGRGDGTFLPPQIFTVGAVPQAIAAGDVTGDGIVDLVTANRAGGTVSVLIGNGDATFQMALHYAVGRDLRALALADVNQDGWLDLAVAEITGITVVLNAADWPPLPIGDGPPVGGGLTPLDVRTTTELRPIPAARQTKDCPVTKVGDEIETAIRTWPTYAPRHIARVVSAETIETALDVSSVTLN